MAKPTGFMEYKREKGEERPFLQRIRDWQPIQLHLPDEKLHTQAARCMDCGIPFCHTGQMLGGMTSGCPLHNLIPEWNDLVYQGNWHEAYHRLSKTNNFPEFTGLVCPAPCEAACTLGIHDPAVTIKQIEYAIIDKAFAEGWVLPEPPHKPTGKRVAVIGSGPAGLACADQLNRVGHDVTVFERADQIGGLLMYGIPNMKLDKTVVQRRVNVMQAAGVKFVANTAVGRDYPIEQLRADFDAAVICTGATRPRDLPTEGRGLAGIHFAVDYLHANTQEIFAAKITATPSAAGKDVVVIGGGDTGTDCVATALRQGCKSMVQFEILPQPPLERATDNPWPQWPRVYHLDYGQAEAQAVFGRDPREYCVLTKRFVGDENGRLQAIETVDVCWQGRVLQEVPGTERTWPAQLVLLALGFLGPEQELLAQLGVAQDGRGNVAVENGRFATSAPGIFAAGDARRGQSLVVWAIAEGRSAAHDCDLWLMGETDLPA